MPAECIHCCKALPAKQTTGSLAPTQRPPPLPLLGKVHNQGLQRQRSCGTGNVADECVSQTLGASVILSVEPIRLHVLLRSVLCGH